MSYQPLTDAISENGLFHEWEGNLWRLVAMHWMWSDSSIAICPRKFEDYLVWGLVFLAIWNDVVLLQVCYVHYWYGDSLPKVSGTIFVWILMTDVSLKVCYVFGHCRSADMCHVSRWLCESFPVYAMLIAVGELDFCNVDSSCDTGEGFKAFQAVEMFPCGILQI